MSAVAQQQPIMTKEFIFKGEQTGTAKKTGKPFRVIELHDPNTLENTRFFIRDGQNVSTTGILFKERVMATFTMDFLYGKPELVLDSISKK